MSNKSHITKDRFFAETTDEYVYRIPIDQRMAEIRLVSAMEMIIKITLPMEVSDDVIKTREYQDLIQMSDWLAEAHGFDPVKGMSWIRPEEETETETETQTPPF